VSRLQAAQKAAGAMEGQLARATAESAGIRGRLADLEAAHERLQQERNSLLDEVEALAEKLQSEQEQTLAFSSQMRERDQRLEQLQRRLTAQETELAALRRMSKRPTRTELPSLGAAKIGRASCRERNYL